MHKGKCSRTTHSFLVPLPLPFPVLKMHSTSELPFPVGVGGWGRAHVTQSQHQAPPPQSMAVFSHTFSHICLSEPSLDFYSFWVQVNRVVPLQTSKAAKIFVDICTAIWHPTPVLLPGKSHGWRSLVGCSPWGR